MNQPQRLNKVLHQSQQQTMTLWHGGNLDKGPPSRSGAPRGTARTRYEYGPGLYLTTSYSIAAQYAKGVRRLYQVTIGKGTDIREVEIPLADIKAFLESNVPRSKQKQVLHALTRHDPEAQQVNADSLVNVLLNEERMLSASH